jgi:hypothetical protein
MTRQHMATAFRFALAESDGWKEHAAGDRVAVRTAMEVYAHV